MTTPATFSRMTSDERRNAVLQTAVKLAEKPGGLGSLQRAHVATKLGCSASLINHHFSNMAGLRLAVVKQGVEDRNLSIIGQAMAAGYKNVRKLDADLKKRAIAHAYA